MLGACRIVAAIYLCLSHKRTTYKILQQPFFILAHLQYRRYRAVISLVLSFLYSLLVERRYSFFNDKMSYTFYIFHMSFKLDNYLEDCCYIFQAVFFFNLI